MQLPTWPTVRTAIIVGLVVRLLAAVFSQGYAMHDDHFVIEDGPYQWFLPDHGGWFERAEPPGHSVVYPGILYGVIVACTSIGIEEPQTQMLVIRILHALLSTLMIPLAAAIARRVGSERSAQASAFLVAVFWILPFLSVRNLIEVMCIVPVMVGVLLMMRRQNTFDIIAAGVAFAVAFLFRYHTALLPATIVLVLALRREWRPAVLLTVSYAIAVALTQGVIDVVVWESFLAAPISYVKSNLAGMDSYTSGPVYQYVLLIIGVLIPPTSLVLLWRVARHDRVAFRWELVVPVVVFVLAHSLITNKQERFILPILPLLLVAVAVAWTDRPNAAQPRSRWMTVAWMWFWFFNTVFLAVFTFSYSKRSRVESLTMLRHAPGVTSVAVITRDGVFVPSFYLGHSIPFVSVSTDTTSPTWKGLAERAPSHVVFYSPEGRDQLLPRVERTLNARLSHVANVEPGLLDATLHWLNPRGNKNETAIVYVVKR
jgi:hypothetical protein